MERKKCYIYTRVSTSTQVDGYSLDAQVETLTNYAKYRDIDIVGEYCDAGISGGNVEGRKDFLRMIRDIVDEKDHVCFVLVFKLSRFGRNSADVVKYMQLLQDYDVDLVSVSESIDSSTQSGKMMLTIMSAVAEIEKDNITAQFMAGKIQKVRSGGWHGGPIPYGYRSVNKELIIEKSEAKIVKMIFEMYAKDGMTLYRVCKYLNENNYLRPYKGDMVRFSDRYVAGILDNPIYYGYFYYNKRSATGKEVEIIKGKHEPIVDSDLWQKVFEKRKCLKRPAKIWDKERESLLTGIIKCPICGDGMISVVSRSKNKNYGGMYKTVYGYKCQHTSIQGNKICTYRKQLNQEKIDAAVYELICKIVNLKAFERFINEEFDYGEVEECEIKKKEVRKQIYCKESEKERLGIKLDGLDILDEHYLDKYDEIENQIDNVYDELSDLEEELECLESKLEKLKGEQIAGENIKRILSDFEKVYTEMSCAEKKKMYRNLIDRIEIYPEEREDRRIIKSITFRFPIIRDEGNDKEPSIVERSFYTLDCSKLGLTKAESHASYAMIKKYVKEKYGLNVSQLYIAQIKRKYGLIERRNYNVAKKENQRVPICPKEKEKCITAALRHFKEIS